ncbi:hypothetical protein [Mesorhizobium sp. M2A.F.Ca.ET.042.01.1.1]|uniref:hypothetical protein n=1 Tax=Mesorhizobium sp. M2A.F.Ca.ET.042.01.1.1 TaxID=2496745 RepID=UPI001FE0E681|nr:hypothetical protein [Mesorhizobium sp. M2A.F.Ca.ET.042.01.1.1]
MTIGANMATRVSLATVAVSPASVPFHQLRLLTNGAFEASVSLYKGQGYSIDREEPFMNGSTVYMSKRIAG